MRLAGVRIPVIGSPLLVVRRPPPRLVAIRVFNGWGGMPKEFIEIGRKQFSRIYDSSKFFLRIPSVVVVKFIGFFGIFLYFVILSYKYRRRTSDKRLPREKRKAILTDRVPRGRGLVISTLIHNPDHP